MVRGGVLRCVEGAEVLVNLALIIFRCVSVLIDVSDTRIALFLGWKRDFRPGWIIGDIVIPKAFIHSIMA